MAHKFHRTARAIRPALTPSRIARHAVLAGDRGDIVRRRGARDGRPAAVGLDVERVHAGLDPEEAVLAEDGAAVPPLCLPIQ